MSEISNTSGAGRSGETPSSASSANPARLLLAGAIGATLAYLFDPVGGGRRRALLRDQVNSFFRSAGRNLNASARDVKHRAQGVVAETRARLSDESPDDEVLAARVRAAIGHRIDRVRPIEVVAEGGRVILTGQAPEAEIDTVIDTARSVRGVTAVDDCLTPQSSAQSSR